jgi:hypothetical protein
MALVHAGGIREGECKVSGIQAKTVPARDWCEPFLCVKAVRFLHEMRESA